VSTIAPLGTENFFEELLEIKNAEYKGSFQLQFSLHSTSQKERDFLIPVKKWSFEKIAEYGNRFYSEGDRKITLNFALNETSELKTATLLKYFDPEKFLIKITPLNPTYKAKANGLKSYFKDFREDKLLDEIKEAGYDYILSIGKLEENQIGSNCGQYVISHKKSSEKMEEGYNYIK
jgi:23S rRNA (adenine2503-C2)-methyltransferase